MSDAGKFFVYEKFIVWDSRTMVSLSIIIIGLLAGILSGLFGLAGGTIIVPGLMIFAHYAQLNASATSLASNLFPVGLFGVITYYKKGHVSVRIVTELALGILFGAWCGSFIALGLSPFTLKMSFGIFLTLLSLRFFFFRGAKNTDETTFPKTPVYALPLTGFTAGILSGLFGIGGGAIMVPIMTELLNFTQKKAAASSLAALLLPVGAFGVINFHNQGLVNWTSATLIMVGLVVGIFLGAKLNLKAPEKTVRLGYGAYLLLIGLGFIGAALF